MHQCVDVELPSDTSSSRSSSKKSNREEVKESAACGALVRATTLGLFEWRALGGHRQ